MTELNHKPQEKLKVHQHEADNSTRTTRSGKHYYSTLTGEIVVPSHCPVCGMEIPFDYNIYQFSGHKGLCTFAARYFDGDIAKARSWLGWNSVASQDTPLLYRKNLFKKPLPPKKTK